ncbi:MAG TPA: hypothetical protein VEB59_06930, partial [Gemmatimonadales bacterium]|nr:hypothetical protein [Gemmatimonadales bacterium]
VRKAGDDKAPYVAVAEYTGTLPAHEQRALQATAPVPAPTPYPSQQPTPTGAAAESDRTAAFIAKQQERAKARPHPLIPARPVQQPAGATP